MMSIRLKLLVAFSIVIALAVGATYYGIRAVSETGRLVVQLYDQPFMAASHAQAAQAHFSEARAAMERGLLLQDTGNGDALDRAVNEVLEELKVVRERTAQPSHAAAIANAERMTQDWHRTGLEIIKPPEHGLTMLPVAANVLRQADDVASAIDQVVEDASAYGFEFRSDAEAAVARSRSNLITLALATGSIGFLLSLGMAYSFGRAIRTAMAVSERIAVGNLSERVSTGRRDELGRLLVSLGRMQEALSAQAESLRTAGEVKERDNAAQAERRQDVDRHIAGFRGSVGELLKQSEAVTTRMTRIARTLLSTSNETRDRAKEAASAAEESSGNVATVAASTEQLDASARVITDKLASATKVVSRATEMARDMNAMIVGLTESVARIDDVSNLIRDIADQTNLLALNATIEAARAGEAGRGFAVVASEVKALASHTSKATEEIGRQISGVQSSTGNAADRIKSIASIMAEITEVTTDIAGAIRQQRAATEEISRSIHSVASATHDVARNVVGTTSAIDDNNRAAAEVLEAAESMTQHAAALRISVDRFLQDVAAA